MSKWEKLNKELDDALNSMTSEDWDKWHEKFKQRQHVIDLMRLDEEPKQVKMKNIHILPTDKPSRLHNTFGILRLEKGLDLSPCNLNIYITNDEEIKEENWVLGDYPDNPIGKVISKYGEEFTMQSLNGNKHGLDQYDSKKIILTTDQVLISNGVQLIDDEFLEWFVKNPSCEWIEVNDWLDDKGNIAFNGKLRYQIIIPAEEPKQETFIEPDTIDGEWLSPLLAERQWQEEQLVNIFEHYPNASPKWQYMNGLIQNSLDARKMYSEEELRNAMNWMLTQYFEFHEWPAIGRVDHYVQSIKQ